MKKFILSTLACLALTGQAAVSVDRIDPPDWYAGLKHSEVQLMVYGKNIRQADVAVNYPGVRVDSVVRLTSPNYLLVYIDLAGAQPGTMPLRFSRGGESTTVNYVIRPRTVSGDRRVGFTNADVLYMLMPDRFADGDTANNRVKGMRRHVVDRTKPSLRHGGDIEGIRQHLDYFNRLGVTALWFTPVLENDSPDSPFGYSTYHGYATTDYYRVDPRFGTNDEYRRLVDEAHNRGLKVVMDMIFNHCGFDHPWVADMPSRDWFNRPEWLDQRRDKRYDDPRGTDYLQTSYKLTPVLDPYASKVDLDETVEGWFVPGMPDLNQRNVHVMNYLIQNSIWWIETAGINGIRMDTYPYAFADAMARWMTVINEEYPNFNVVGETWVERPPYTATWQTGSRNARLDSHLKTVMDFAFRANVDSARVEVTDDWWRGFNRVYNDLVFDYLYPDPSSVMAFIENHDTDRFLKDGRDARTLKQALALLLTIKRIPQLYYGTEILMNGTKTESDGNVRRDFPGGFPGDARDAFTAAGRTAEENEMFDWLSRLLHWRQGNAVIVDGGQTQFIPKNGVYVIARHHNGKAVLTLVNGTDGQRDVDLKRYAEVIGSSTRAVDVPTGRAFDLSHGTVTMTPRGALVLELQ